MNKIFLFLILILFSCQEKKAVKIDKESLKTQLDSIQQLDQKYRRMLGDTIKKYGRQSPQTNMLWEKQSQLDSMNLIAILNILDNLKVYPGDSLVGYPTSKAAFFVLQHAPDSVQEKYLPLILNAAENRQLDTDLAAMYHDRYLMNKGLPQIYGSQIRIRKITDSLTGEKTEIHQVYKIADTSKVDSLRAANGMIPLKEYLDVNGAVK
ncbi:MAG: DUF6624 domain-containing protein [Flavobacteriales bacterium]